MDNIQSRWTTFRKQYLSKFSGPLMNRIDLYIEVPPVPFEDLSSLEDGEKSVNIRQRVIVARERQVERFKEYLGIYSNATMPAQMVQKICAIDK